MALSTATCFATPAQFGARLQAHGAHETELVVGFWKVGSGRPGMAWPEWVDEALCVGWIDGVRKRIDEQAYQIRFTCSRSALTPGPASAINGRGQRLACAPTTARPLWRRYRPPAPLCHQAQAPQSHPV